MSRLLLLVLVPFLTGCGTSQYVLCMGKGSITTQGIYGAGVTVDCPPPGLEFYSGKTPMEAPPSGTTPAVPGKLFAPATVK